MYVNIVLPQELDGDTGISNIRQQSLFVVGVLCI